MSTVVVLMVYFIVWQPKNTKTKNNHLDNTIIGWGLFEDTPALSCHLATHIAAFARDARQFSLQGEVLVLL